MKSKKCILVASLLVLLALFVGIVIGSIADRANPGSEQSQDEMFEDWNGPSFNDLLDLKPGQSVYVQYGMVVTTEDGLSFLRTSYREYFPVQSDSVHKIKVTRLKTTRTKTGLYPRAQYDQKYVVELPKGGFSMPMKYSWLKEEQGLVAVKLSKN